MSSSLEKYLKLLDFIEQAPTQRDLDLALADVSRIYLEEMSEIEKIMADAVLSERWKEWEKIEIIMPSFLEKMFGFWFK